MSKKTTIARMRRDATRVEVLPDGSERPFPDRPPRQMTEQEVLREAVSDPDAQPLTDADFARMKQTPRAKIIRRALGLSQEEFSSRYQIPLGTLRDWEQGRSEPDQTAQAYLKAIAGDPDAIYQALQFAPH